MVSRPWMNLLIFLGSGKRAPLAGQLPQRCKSGGIRLERKTGGLFDSAKSQVLDVEPLGRVPTVSVTSPNLPLSPLVDLTEFLFPAADESRMMSLDYLEYPLRNEDILNEMLLPPTSDSVTVNDVEFGEVFTDIDDLLNMNGSSVVAYQHASSENTYDEAPVLVADECVIVPQSVELLTLSVEQTNELCSSSYVEPDHNYSTVKTTTRKRKISEISEYSVGEGICSGDDNKLTKYLERRRKNNIASKRSRETRKTRFLSMDEQADELEKSNLELRQRIEQLESLTKRMKEALVAKLSATN